MPRSAVTGKAPLLPAGADPDEVRDWFEFETIVSLPAPAASFAEAEAAAADYRRAARADNTRRAYRAAVDRFTEWCAAHAQTALPAAPETVAAFLAAEAGKALRSTPCGCAMPPCAICTCSPAIRRRPPHRWSAPPFPASAAPTAGHCAKRPHSCSSYCAPRCRRFRTPCPACATGCGSGRLCRSIAPERIGGADARTPGRHEDGTALFLPWRKNDPEAEGTTVWLPSGRTDLCPVKALEAWLAAAAISEGPLFRRLWRLPPPRLRRGAKRKPIADRYRIGTNPIDSDSIALVLKKWTGQAGFDAAAFAGHSLCRGAISSGVAQGVHIARLKQFSGDASLKSLEEYVELDELRHNHPLKDVP
jgi:hypothetical protein